MKFKLIVSLRWLPVRRNVCLRSGRGFRRGHGRERHRTRHQDRRPRHSQRRQDRREQNRVRHKKGRTQDGHRFQGRGQRYRPRHGNRGQRHGKGRRQNRRRLEGRRQDTAHGTENVAGKTGAAAKKTGHGIVKGAKSVGHGVEEGHRQNRRCGEVGPSGTGGRAALAGPRWPQRAQRRCQVPEGPPPIAHRFSGGCATTPITKSPGGTTETRPHTYFGSYSIPCFLKIAENSSSKPCLR